MTMLQKTLIVVTLAAAVGTVSYETHQTSHLLEQAQALQQQQAPFLEKIRQLQHKRDEAENRAATLLTENVQLRSSSHSAEILELRGEAARLEAVAAQKETDSTEPAVNAWLYRVNQVKQYAAQHPDETSPEFSYLTAREWLIVVDTGDLPIDFGKTMLDLKSQAAVSFAHVVVTALRNYALANNGQFPSDLSQLQAYCDAGTEEILQQRYEIKPASVLMADLVKEQNIKTDWVIAGKEPVASNAPIHIAIYSDGITFFW